MSTSRWLTWTPKNGSIFQENPEPEPPKPPEPTFEGFEGSTLEQIQKSSDRPQDAWREDFIEWARERCALRDDREDSASIACLLLDFAKWCTAHENVPCQRAEFEALLEGAGLRCAGGMAAGIVLKVDLETVLHSQAATTTTVTPARGKPGEPCPFGSYPSRFTTMLTDCQGRR